jgi:hypothetical protein
VCLLPSQLAERLKQCEGMGQLSDTADDRPGQEPDWLQQLRYRQQGIQVTTPQCITIVLIVSLSVTFSHVPLFVLEMITYLLGTNILV